MAFGSSAIKPLVTEVGDSIFDCIANLVIAVDQKGRISIFNHTCERLFGIPAEKALHRPISQVIPYTGLIKVLKTGKSHIGRKFVLGNTLFVVNRTPIIKDNRVVGAIGVAQEITELHQMAEELERIGKQKEVLESIFDGTGEGYLSINCNGYINFVNQAMANFLKMDQSKIVNQHITEIIPETKSHLFQIDGRTQQNSIIKLAGQDLLMSSYPVQQQGKIKGSVSKFYFHMDQLAELTKNINIKPKKNSKSNYSLDDIIGSSEAISQLKKMVQRVAAGPSTVLITGASGTGKELFAHALHATSQRAGKPFIKVNCAAIPENLLESELFGYREGAFTGSRKGGQVGKFELAHGGTIFLDEIGDMPLSMQAKVLRVLQEKEIERLGDKNTKKIDVRITAATNRDLETLIAEGGFRQDLYYRLNVVKLDIPPLRERKVDIMDLVPYFILKFNRSFSLRVTGISQEVLKLFQCYHWPGNVRELESIIERAFNLVEGDTINMEQMPNYLLKFKESRTKEPESISLEHGLPVLLEGVEKAAIEEALKKTGGNKLQSAKLLGISRAWLYKKIKQYKIS